MKTIYTRLAFFAMLCFLSFNSLQAQTPLTNAVAGSVTLSGNVGGTANRSSIAYNPNLQLYYSVNAGSSSYPIQTFDASGSLVNDVTSNFDFRGAWWNDALSQLEGNGYNALGVSTTALDGNGYATSTNTVIFAGNNQPNTQSIGDLDYDANEILYYDNGSIYRYDRTNNASLGNYTLNNTPAGATLNQYAVMYTGVAGHEIALYDYTNQKVLFYDKATGNYAAESQLPAAAPMPSAFQLSYANDMVWLYDFANATWLSYEIWDNCPTISLDNSTDVSCSGGSDGSLSISTSGGASGGGLFISEANVNTPDFVEITTTGTIDVTGYQVVVSDDYSNINIANTQTWTLSGTLTAGTVLYQEDVTGTNYWGNNMFWSSGNNSWAIIIDASGNIVDAVFWGWTAADISTFSITVGGLTVTNSGAWTGDGLNSTCTTSFVRSASSDTNTDADWTCGTESKGTNNLTITGGGSPLTYTWSSGQTTDSIGGLMAGTYIVTVSDGGSCSVVDSFVVGTAVDNMMPTVVTQDITVILDANGNASIVPADIDNGSSDNCAVASVALDVSSFDCSNVGANTVTLTVTDGSGNAATGTATVTVQDIDVPTLTTQDITLNLDASGNISITAADVISASSDNCSIASSSVDITSFTDLDVGPNTVTVTVTDPTGNNASATAIVTIEYAVNTTGIEKETVAISAYPNPAHDVIRLKMTNVNEPTVLATLMDINGRIISTAQLQTQDAQMNISALPQGNYFIRIQTNEMVKTVKFVKH